jgi:hypothetical protein
LLALSFASIFTVEYAALRENGSLRGHAVAGVFCDRMEWLVIGKRFRHPGTTIWKQRGYDAFFFEAGMAIDADGSPRAYHPLNIGLDDNRHGKDASGRWVGVVLGNGKPYVQGPHDPAPGYYVSATSLYDPAKPLTDPARYVDSEKIPYLALPGQVMHPSGICIRDAKACLGDLAVVLNRNNGRVSYAILADRAPHSQIGEGSIALAEALGVNPDPRNGGNGDGIRYLIFPGTGDERPKSSEEIKKMGDKAFRKWGGMEKMEACFAGEI